jgi:protein-arginine kinase
VELDTKKQKEDKEKEEKKRVDKEKRDADIRNAELEKFYKSLSDEEKKSITDLAEKSLSHISQKARDDFPDNYRLFLQNKRRQITEVYKNTGKLPDLQTK